MSEPRDAAAADAALFASLRAVWNEVDPVPAELVDSMIAAIAVEDLTREYALLALVDGAGLAAVRGEADTATATLQFSDGTTSVLLHVTDAEEGGRRVDGWVDAAAVDVRLLQGGREWTTEVGERGRFAFTALPSGVSRLRLAVRDGEGVLHEFQTPQFEV